MNNLYKINFNREKFLIEKEKNKMKWQVILYCFILFFSFFLAVGLPLTWYLGDRNDKIKKRHQEEMQLAALDSELTNIKGSRMHLSEIMKFMRWFNQNTIPWADKLAAMGKIKKKRLWLTDFFIQDEIDYSKKGKNKRSNRAKKKSNSAAALRVLTIKGKTQGSANRNLREIAKLIIALNDLSSFNKDFYPLKLLYTKDTEEVKGRKKKNITEFELKGIAKKSDGIFN